MLLTIGWKTMGLLTIGLLKFRVYINFITVKIVLLTIVVVKD